ncbi:MAG: SDR family NAD(P)-dependent oxidoreductase, partial [Pseudomonadota bacterium]
MSLKGKTLFVTGASRGIGKAIALRAAQDGANIAIAAKTAEPHPKLEGTIFTASSSRTSTTSGRAFPPAASISSAAVKIVPSSLGCGSAVLAAMAMLAPSCAALSAIALP